MNVDPSGEFAISLTILGLIIGAVIGATAGGVVSYNIAKDNGAEGWELFGWTVLGIVAGGVIGGGIGAGVGALLTYFTGVTGLSVTKYSILLTHKVTILGNVPTYTAAATATGSGYYEISTKLYNNLTTLQRWDNNLQYLKDAHKLGTQFVMFPDFVVKHGYTLWLEFQYLLENNMHYILG